MRLVISSSSETPDTLWRWPLIAFSSEVPVVWVPWAAAVSLPTFDTNVAYDWSAVPPASWEIWIARSLPVGSDVELVWIELAVADTAIVEALLPLKNGLEG